MTEIEKLLLYILAGALAAFLILAIIISIKLIRVINHIENITEAAEKIANQAEAVGDFFSKSAGPIAIGRLITNLAEAVWHKSSSKKKEK